jgi:class 3 adenylate cyclase
MICDLVGSVTLSERLDAEDLRELLTSYQRRATSIIKAVAGLVARYQGDAILAYFGYPFANEDDAERAVRESLELVKRIRELGPDQLSSGREGHPRPKHLRRRVCTEASPLLA